MSRHGSRENFRTNIIVDIKVQTFILFILSEKKKIPGEGMSQVYYFVLFRHLCYTFDFLEVGESCNAILRGTVVLRMWMSTTSRVVYFKGF